MLAQYVDGIETENCEIKIKWQEKKRERERGREREIDGERERGRWRERERERERERWRERGGGGGEIEGSLTTEHHRYQSNQRRVEVKCTLSFFCRTWFQSNPRKNRCFLTSSAPFWFRKKRHWTLDENNCLKMDARRHQPPCHVTMFNIMMCKKKKKKKKETRLL